MSTPTIIDVSKKSGLSVGTVSRVIRGLPGVRPSRVAAVKQAIATLKYVPLPPGQRPGPRGPRRKHNPGGAVAVIFAQRTLKWVMNAAPVYAAVLHGIETALAGRGIKLALQQTTAGTDDWRGVIVFGDEASPTSQVPTVHAMGTPRSRVGDHVCPDHHRVGGLAAEYALAHGHRHCAYLGTGADFAEHKVVARAAVFKQSIAEAGGHVTLLNDPDLLIVDANTQAPDETALARQLHQLLALNPRPSLLLVQADIFTPSVYRQLLERGVQPQRDLTIITCNNERPFLNSLQPAPVIIDLQAEAIGRRAVDQLLWRIEHPREPAMRIMIEPVLLQGPNL